MNLIAYEAQSWELYRDDDHYYLSMTVDQSAAGSCWDLVLDREEIQAYEHRGKQSIQQLVRSILQLANHGDYSAMEGRLAKPYERLAMQSAFKRWQNMRQDLD
ncbi:hypothetical protein D7V64_10420 [Acinetobacter cumulans]|uniref:Uncharacterized protein n=1 Tax=Acinetobacter cumulans TaxID=2136182 RepID=A0A3A8G0X3_9GAMM|nr:hypothetical protein [Acinetobacter cumulans]RKG52099.1 hypothetical protein D7V64_10420 [Acinetobacter cumulans]